MEVSTNPVEIEDAAFPAHCGRENCRGCAAMDVTAFPARWHQETPRSYGGYVTLVPCRVLTRRSGRVEIEALREDGTTSVHWIAIRHLLEEVSA